jgi:DNA-binding MarR family transcriptional regulator
MLFLFYDKFMQIFVVRTISMATEKFITYSYLLERTARKVKQYAQRRFNAENYDITVDQWLILKNLSSENDLNQSQLAEITGKDHPTLTRIIDLLCRKGLTERKVHPFDRRSFHIHLTDLGNNRVTEWSPKMSEIRMKAWENLTEDDYLNLKRILDTIYNNLDMENE